MLVGRPSERQMIGELIAAARLGRGGVLVLTGEPGVGKTALLTDAAQTLTGMRTLHAVGTESERELPFGGLSQLLRPALDLLPTIPEPQRLALAAALALGPGRPTDRFAVCAATLSLLCRYAEDRPLAVLIDDLHLWDRPSTEALRFAASRLAADPIAVLATARSAEADGVLGDLPRLEVAGLDVAATSELLTARSASPVAPDLLDRLHRTTAGNPLALLELAGELVQLERTWPDSPVPVGAALSRAFTERARDLADDTRTALLVLAAADGDLRLVTPACAALGIDVGRLAAAEEKRLITVRGDRASFRHPLVRAAVYADAPAGLRRRAHRALAGVLPESDVERRAWHLAEATLGPEERVGDLLALAGDRARGRSAFAVASAAYERSARLSPDGDVVRRRLLAAAETAWSAGASGRSLGLLADVEVAGTVSPTGGDDEVRVLELRAAIAGRTGRPGAARDLFRAAADRAADADRAVPLLADAAYACYYQGDVRTALSLAAELDALAPRAHTAEAAAFAATAAGAARILGNAGGDDQLRAGLELLTDLPADPAGRRLAWLLTGLLFLRDTPSQRTIAGLVDQARADAAVGVLPLVLFLLARDAATTDRWSRAEATYTEAIALARESGNLTDLGMALAGLAWLLAKQGREPEFDQIATEAGKLLAVHDLPVMRIWLLAAEADQALALGRTAVAAARQVELIDLLDGAQVDDPDLSPVPDRVEVLLQLGADREADELARAFLPVAVAKGRPWVLARAERALGLCATEDAVDAHFRTALAAHAQTLDRFEEARTHLCYGERLRRSRRRAESRNHLRAALTAFEELGARPWADRAAHELAATGEHVRRRADDGAAALTPQELQVALLLAEGRTTRDVAAALFLSPKTVEYHLRKVYTKLGIRSRAELTAALPD